MCLSLKVTLWLEKDVAGARKNRSRRASPVTLVRTDIVNFSWGKPRGTHTVQETGEPIRKIEVWESTGGMPKTMQEPLYQLFQTDAPETALQLPAGAG